MVEYKSSLDQLNNMKNKEIILGMDHNINFLKHDVHPKTQEFIEKPRHEFVACNHQANKG